MDDVRCVIAALSHLLEGESSGYDMARILTRRWRTLGWGHHTAAASTRTGGVLPKPQGLLGARIGRAGAPGPNRRMLSLTEPYDAIRNHRAAAETFGDPRRVMIKSRPSMSRRSGVRD